ncbi:MAG: MotA/TolQ/ExbB proton channel family protein [Gloeobacteraceae cyanobacterium ES-bin-144]|nr:MotA/TolQ/ExbB proton channel family protein [Verrucomicrobiales bacterium]
MKCRHFSVLGFFLTASLASAAAVKETEPVASHTNFLEILAKGGLMMFPLGLLSVLTVILILIFLLTIRRNAIVSDRFMNAAEAMIRKRDYLGLIAYSHRRNECMARIAQKSLEFLSGNPGVPFENVREVAQTEGSRQAGMLTSRITYLADIGAIAPMVGLLGTVIGMIKAFIEIAAGGKQGVREMGLAEGVSEALIATAGGLGISIIALVFYSLFRGRVQKYTAELEAAATHLIAQLHGQFDRQAASSFAASVPQGREDFAMPVPSPLAGTRPDVHGI